MFINLFKKVTNITELKPQIQVTINVKSLTGYQDSNTENNKTTSTTETTDDKKENTPKKVTLRVTVDDEQVENKQVNENDTNIKVPVSGKGVITIKVYIDDTRKAQVHMDLNTTQELTID